METKEQKLTNKRCVPCEGGIPALTVKEIEPYIHQIDKDWKIVENKKISREISFVNYKHTIDFVKKVAKIAEEENHHPVMHVYYGKVEIELWTHAIDGLSENDFILAAKIDEV